MQTPQQGVIVLGPAWHSCGSHLLHRAQVSAYQALGFETYFLAVCPYYSLVGEAWGYWDNYRAATTDLVSPFRGEAKLPASTLWSPIVWADRVRNRNRTPCYSRSLVSKYSVLPDSIVAFVNQHNIKRIHCNHYFNLPLAKCLQALAPGSKIICETQDVQSRHLLGSDPSHPITRKKGTFEAYFADEVRCAEDADEFVHLNEDEFEIFSAAIPHKKHHLIFPMVERPVAAAATKEDVDFLIVSSANMPNYNSLIWFFENVWDSDLNQMAKLKVVGNVEKYFRRTNRRLWKKYSECFVGRVEDVSPWYARSKTILAPVTEGQGISMKTVEALSYGKAFLFSPLALRGFTNQAAGFNLTGQCESAAQFRTALKAILMKSATIKQHVNNVAALAIYESLFSPEIYRKQIAAI